VGIGLDAFISSRETSDISGRSIPDCGGGQLSFVDFLHDMLLYYHPFPQEIEK